jgi:xanthine/CO dehydrogenase XdhC/CoxF family maturation factor
MLRNELLEMISLAERLAAAGEPAVLATLFLSSGSTYRPLGSMMVSGPASMIAGGVSGGCLEEYIARHGRSLTQVHAATLLSFHTDLDGDAAAKPALGCGGSIEVLVERITSNHLTFLREFYAAATSDAPRTAACVVDTSDSSAIAVSRLWLADEGPDAVDAKLEQLKERSEISARSRHSLIAPSRSALVHYIPPMTRLVIFGAGDDARPLCTLARSLGWHVTVADRRARLAAQVRFPDADHVVSGDWPTIVEQIVLTPQSAVVLMTHSLPDDTEILPLLAQTPAAYIGVLGPEHRRRWLLDAVAETHELTEAFIARVRGPIGLDLGDRSAPGIAVSVVSEILAVLNARQPTPLSETASQLPNGPRAKVMASHV